MSKNAAHYSLEAHFGDMKEIKIIVEKHPDAYVAYPLGIKGIVAGQGDTYDEALKDVQSAIAFHIETFGKDVVEARSVP